MSPAVLPAVLQEIADVAGVDAALAIADAKGGLRVYIPVAVTDDHWLTRAVGREAADIICKHFAFVAEEGIARHGAQVEIPLGPNAGTIRRARAAVDRMIGENRSEAEIARTVGYTGRGVRKRRARQRVIAERQKNQLKLF